MKQPREFAIRVATIDDAAAIAALSAQVDRKARTRDLTKHLCDIVEADWQDILIAHDVDGHSVAWLHVKHGGSLLPESHAEVLALVVDEECIERGLGERMIEEAESWGRARGCPYLGVHSGVFESRPKRFYRGLGFDVDKDHTQLRKNL